MIDDDNKGIANLLGVYKTPVRTPKVEPQEDPIISLSESLMRIKPLELPKNVTKEDYKYNDKNPRHRRELREYLTRDTSQSKGAFNAYVKADKDPNRPKNVHATEYMEQMKNKHGSYDNYSKKLVKYGADNSQQKIGNAPPGSKQQKQDVLNYVNKMVEELDGPKISDQPILKENIKYVGNRSNNPSWMKELEKTGPYGKNKNKRFVNKSLNSFENRTDNKHVVTFDPTTQLFTDDTRNIAFKDYHQAKRWNDAVNGQPTATGQQVNNLKARLDNSRTYGYDPEEKKEMRKSESVNPNKNKRYI